MNLAGFEKYDGLGKDEADQIAIEQITSMTGQNSIR